MVLLLYLWQSMLRNILYLSILINMSLKYTYIGKGIPFSRYHRIAWFETISVVIRKKILLENNVFSPPLPLSGTVCAFLKSHSTSEGQVSGWWDWCEAAFSQTWDSRRPLRIIRAERNQAKCPMSMAFNGLSLKECPHHSILTSQLLSCESQIF